MLKLAKWFTNLLLIFMIMLESCTYSFAQTRLKIDESSSTKNQAGSKTRLDLDSISSTTRLNLEATIKNKTNSLTRLNLDEYGQKLNIKQVGEAAVQTTKTLTTSIPNKKVVAEWEELIEKANKILDKEILDESNVEEAVELNKKALELKPKAINAYLGLGYAYLRVRDFEKSAFYYKEAVNQDPKNVEARVNLGIAVYYTGRIDEAIKEYTNALNESKKPIPELNFNLGVAYAHKGNFEQAIEYYKTALNLQKNYAEVYNNLGLLYEARDNFDSARDSFKEAIKSKNGNYPLAYYNLARLQIFNRDYSSAIKSLTLAIEQKKFFSQAYLTLGNAHLLLGNTGQDLKVEEIDLAIKNYKQAIELNNNFYPLAHENLAIALSQKDKNKDALGEFRVAVEQYEGKCPKTFANLLAVLNKENISPIFIIGDELADRDNPSSLKRRYRDLQVLKKNADGLEQDYKTQLFANLQELLDKYENLDDKEKNFPDVRFCAGRIYLVTNKLKEAINEFDLGLKSSNNSDEKLFLWLRATLQLLFSL